ncbi:hypothetical protein GYA19_05120 [Candidatus Beckwithbacteria bacterium]|nr:hypothetical protein [Candidatus Beckwithbacteria bacterium]
MKLTGGVIIIGSLIWDPDLEKGDNLRKDWRDKYLLDKRTYTKLPIRYGKISQKRNKVYTMVFSKSCEKNLGQGLILQFKDYVTGFETIKRQAIALAIAEGIYKNDNLRLTSNWGSVGLLLNPKLRQNDIASYELIKEEWSKIYHSYRDTFVSESYKTIEESESVITSNGVLNITWQEEMNLFDLLIATPVVPKPKSIPNPHDIAKTFQSDSEYFFQNQTNQIITSCDKEILIELQK